MKGTMFSIFPAIDLRCGQVVRLKMGDPSRQTKYSDDPAETAQRWLEAGARYLHVINLDGAFQESDSKNLEALKKIIETTYKYGARVQFGGGLRSSAAIEHAFNLGVSRVILGTVIIEQRQVLTDALKRWGPEQVAAALDARDGFIQVRGWKENTRMKAVELAIHLQEAGLRWLIFTDITHDGMGSGINLEQTLELSKSCSLQIIASGGASSLDDIRRVRQAGLAGVIVGQALYSGSIQAEYLFQENFWQK